MGQLKEVQFLELGKLSYHGRGTTKIHYSVSVFFSVTIDTEERRLIIGHYWSSFCSTTDYKNSLKEGVGL